MIAVLLVSLFTAAAMLASGALAHSWWRYGAAALAVRPALLACDDSLAMRYTIRAVVRPGYGQVIRADFKPRKQPARHAA